MDHASLPGLPEDIAGIAAALGAGLPGEAARGVMLPPPRRGLPLVPAKGGPWRAAAVLVLLHSTSSGVAFPLVMRSPHFGSHRGEIGLPGGSLEGGESAEEAALRETMEELGLGPEAGSGIGILGPLSPLRVPPSGFEVFPFVGWLRDAAAFTPLVPEIEGIIEVPLADLLAPEATASACRSVDGVEVEVPCYLLGGEAVWGATAMILAEFAAIAARAFRAGRRQP